MRVEAINTIVLGGKHHAPGSILEVEQEDFERFISLGAARPVDSEPEAASDPESPSAADAAVKNRRNGRH